MEEKRNRRREKERRREKNHYLYIIHCTGYKGGIIALWGCYGGMAWGVLFSLRILSHTIKALIKTVQGVTNTIKALYVLLCNAKLHLCCTLRAEEVFKSDTYYSNNTLFIL